MRIARRLVATYHYVRPRNSDGVTGITPERFREQIEWIMQRYTIVGAEAFAGRRDDTAPLALITFDDALRDQCDYAAPILDDLGVPGVFFAPMRPCSDEPDPWCAQHLLHALAEHLGWSEVERRVESLLPRPPVIDQDRVDALYHYEVPRKRRLKYLMAFALVADEAAAILRAINADAGLDHRDWFMSPDDLRRLRSGGHEIGAHGFDHTPYTTMSPEAQRRDMRRADALLHDILGHRPRTIAFPFGRHDDATDALVREFGYDPVFTTGNRIDAAEIPALMRAASEERIPA